jgi:hypothetical protein
MQGSLITAFESVSVSENAGEPARLWRPRHVHVRSLKVLSNVVEQHLLRVDDPSSFRDTLRK